MAISTTVCMYGDTLERINEIRAKRGMSRNDAVVMLLRRAMQAGAVLMKTGTAVRYQKSVGRGEWHVVHVRFARAEYEFFTDLRKVYKMSVSSLLAYAAMGFLDDGEEGDNYCFCSHDLSFLNQGMMFRWIISWNPTKHSPEKTRKQRE